MTSKKNLKVLFLSNINYLSSEYLRKLIKENPNYHFELFYGKEDKDENKIKTHLQIGTFFSKKKFIIMNDYSTLSDETINLIKTSINRVWIVFNNKTALYQKLAKMKIFMKKDQFYNTPQKCMELVNMFADNFLSYDMNITKYLVEKFSKDPNKLVQQIRVLALWKSKITKKDVLQFYKDFPENEIYKIARTIISGNKKAIYKIFMKMSDNSEVLAHLFNWLLLVLKDLTKFRLYELSGFRPLALLANWSTKQLYQGITNYQRLSKLANLLKRIEEDDKFQRITLTKAYFLNALLCLN